MDSTLNITTKVAATRVARVGVRVLATTGTATFTTTSLAERSLR
jgi:hypothetical protein